jgi:DNA-binding NarL/FixJ family response regulator
MARISCLAGIDGSSVRTFCAIIAASRWPDVATVSALNVSELGFLDPTLLICDVDDVFGDPIEMLRQIRFVLPTCVIAVYTGILTATRSRACHSAGANGVLAKGSSHAQLARGLASALVSGCFTDPRFAA